MTRCAPSMPTRPRAHPARRAVARAGRRRPGPRSLAAVAVLAVACLAPAGTQAAFSTSTGNGGNSASAHPDWTEPIVARGVLVKGEGGIPGFMRPGGQYRYVAHIVDDPSANPPAGLGAVTAFAANLPMTGSAETVNGEAYTHSSALRAAPAAGNYNATLTAPDLADPVNTATYTTTVTCEGVAPAAQQLVFTNAGGTAGRPNAGDTVTFPWGEIVDPDSVVNGWTGAAPVNATVRIANNANNDTLTVYNDANTALLPLGSIALGQDYVSAATTFGAPGQAVRSTVAWAANQLGFVVTLGTPVGTVSTATATGTTVWTPAAGVYDRAGNPSTTATVTEAGAADREF